MLVDESEIGIEGAAKETLESNIAIKVIAVTHTEVSFLCMYNSIKHQIVLNIY